MFKMTKIDEPFLSFFNLSVVRRIFQSGKIHVWQFLLDSSEAEDFEALLSLEELEKASRFRFQQDRERFVKSHALLRCVLSFYSKIEPEKLAFGYGTHGKPFLSNPIEKPMNFNLSHSHNLVCCAITESGKIGMDIEHICPEFDFGAAMEIFFKESEIRAIKSLPENLQAQTFFRIWTRKEALGKALGVGLSQEITPEEESRWVVRNLTGMKDYAGAIAYEKTEENL